MTSTRIPSRYTSAAKRRGPVADGRRRSFVATAEPGGCAARHREDTLSHRERVAAERASPCAESSANCQRRGGVKGQGFHGVSWKRPFDGSVAVVQRRAWRPNEKDAPHPGNSALTAAKLIHGRENCALQCRPSPAGRGWRRFSPRVLAVVEVHPPTPSSEPSVCPARLRASSPLPPTQSQRKRAFRNDSSLPSQRIPTLGATPVHP